MAAGKLSNGHKAMLIAIAIVAVVADQITKWWATQALSEGQTIPLVGDFISLHLIFNPGAAFSLGEGTTWIFTALAIIACVVLPYFVLRMRSALERVAMTFVWAGAFGNLIDRLFRAPGPGRGHVVDFINYNDWFIGNVADIELVVAVLVLVIFQALVGERADEAQAPKE